MLNVDMPLANEIKRKQNPQAISSGNLNTIHNSRKMTVKKKKV
jgi:hypothetical protein